MLIEFTPTGVCSRKITFEIEDGKIYGLKFYGGCPGNLSAISKLLEGADALVTADVLRGNRCKDRATSCTDQLAIAIEQAVSSQRKAS
ncbi:MAG: TIGR03905 family TSCPD domain-containing protein [Synergistaceae bacterium]|nr:TIGR03905 family TSCPD domain-containing protein [Synergistaceae bacterium]